MCLCLSIRRDLAQGEVEDMRGGVVLGDERAAAEVNLQ